MRLPVAMARLPHLTRRSGKGCPAAGQRLGLAVPRAALRSPSGGVMKSVSSFCALASRCVSVGNGLYRSLDGGHTWQHLGLDKTGPHADVARDPGDPRVAYVAALGQVWGENPERGVFKTEDGGKTWRKVLYVDERTGAAQLVMDPANPRKLFAAMWDFRRWPWAFRSGGPGSGLFVTYDGGEHWRKLTEDDGLPKGDFGRVGVAIAPSDPRVVYALVEAEQSALARSEDGGRTFKAVNTEVNVSPRPFYFAGVHVDPADPNRIYRREVALD